MKTERERKFLVNGEISKVVIPPNRLVILQGFFAVAPVQIRVRLTSEGRGSVCFKIGVGEERTEIERGISRDEAAALLDLAPARIVKERYEIDGWEIDRFGGPLNGFWLAEYEERKGKPPFPETLPPWLSREVTGDPRYTNGSLAASGVPVPAVDPSFGRPKPKRVRK